MISPARKKWLKKLLQQYGIFLRDFFRDLFDAKLEHYTASLSWSTLFAIIPLMALVIAVFTSLPLFGSLRAGAEKLVLNNLLPADSQLIMAYIDKYIANAGELGLLGAIYIIFALGLFFKTYDYIVNDIFKAPLRGALAVTGTYVLLTIAIPLIAGLSVMVENFSHQHRWSDYIYITDLLPWFMVWMSFYLLYQFSPNKKIAPQSALTSSFIAALVWSISKYLFVIYVAHNRTYTTIYGSISALMFFLLWIHISWAIFIHGLKFCALLEGGEEIKRI